VVAKLTAGQIIELHDQVIAASGGGMLGVRDSGRVEAAASRMYSGFGEIEFYPTPLEKAAAMIESIICDHPFVDGNKRTAVHAAATYLELCGMRMDYTTDEVVTFAIGVATHEIAFDGIVAWLRQHSRER
jgi:death-on-curing protein